MMLPLPKNYIFFLLLMTLATTTLFVVIVATTMCNETASLSTYTHVIFYSNLFDTHSNTTNSPENHSEVVANKLTQNDEINEVEMERMFEARRQKVKTVCRRRFSMSHYWLFSSIAKQSKSYPFHFIMLDEEHKILHCVIPKVASTTWRRFYVLLGLGYDVDSGSDLDIDLNEWNATWPFLKPLSTYARENTDTLYQRIKDYKKIMWVRDPFQRLVSAWRSKLQLKNEYYWERIGKKILSAYPENVSLEALKMGGPVSLKSFFQYLMEKNVQDPHWQPFFKICLPCHLNYDYIGKLEGGDVEANYVIRKTTGQRKLMFPRNTFVMPKKLLEDAVSEVAELPSTLVNGIKSRYRLDFEMFAY